MPDVAAARSVRTQMVWRKALGSSALHLHAPVSLLCCGLGSVQLLHSVLPSMAAAAGPHLHCRYSFGVRASSAIDPVWVVLLQDERLRVHWVLAHSQGDGPLGKGKEGCLQRALHLSTDFAALLASRPHADCALHPVAAIAPAAAALCSVGCPHLLFESGQYAGTLRSDAAALQFPITLIEHQRMASEVLRECEAISHCWPDDESGGEGYTHCWQQCAAH